MLVLFLCCVLSCEWLFVTPWTVACQASLSDFASKITGAGCHFLLQGIFPTQEWNLNLGHLLISCLSLSHQGSPVLFHHFHFHALEKDMATHSSVLAWKIPGMEEPGRLQSMGPQSWTGMRDFTFTFHFHASKKEMATHSSVLSWRIPGTEEPGRLLSMWLQRVRHDWSDLAAVAMEE